MFRIQHQTGIGYSNKFATRALLSENKHCRGKTPPEVRVEGCDIIIMGKRTISASPEWNGDHKGLIINSPKGLGLLLNSEFWD